MSIIYAFLGMYFMYSLPIGAGDEGLFIADIEFINRHGWFNAIKKGISVPHSILAYPLSLIFEPFIALRLLNIILLVILYGYFYYRNKPTVTFFIYLTFFIGTCKVFFMGTNDSLFVVCLAIFFNEVHQFNLNKTWGQSLALSVLLICIFTRALIVMYLPAVLICLFYIYRIKGFSKRGYVIPVFAFMVFMLMNLPAIAANGKLSYDRKSPPEDVNVSWAQRQYLAQLMVNEGKLSNYQHPSFKATQDYVDKNGERSLPKTLFQGVLFNPILTIKEFFKDAADILKYGTRQLGLILIIVLGYLMQRMLKRKIFDFENSIPIALLITIAAFALIIISFIELRWFVGIFISTIVFYTFLEQTNKTSKLMSKLNLLTITLLMIYGTVKIIPQL
ncbi:hypothetical protein [Winogradskyella sp.]|uniref:hypothetical protein n=2 Tax=Winogradskyella sp. TaxID=1883156 RepID=UPI0035155836